jgi:hypothetical protein
MTTELTIELFCDSCWRSQGLVSLDEFQMFGGEEGAINLCFDCEQSGASTVPGLFWQWQEGDVFVLGDVRLEVSGNTYPGKPLLRVTHARDHAHARSCLSSSTYLHKTAIKNGGEVQETDTHWPCSECHNGWLWPKENGWKCDRCSYFGPKIRKIVIPSWILEPARGNLSKIDTEPICYPCLYARDLGRGEYCDYHRALLIEQNEDGSLGWGNETR